MRPYNYSLTVLLFTVLSTCLSSCEIVGGIFKAGVWTGLILVALVIVIIIWIISRMRR